MSSNEELGASMHHISVRRTARYAVIGEPGPHIRDVWLVCHGHAQLAKKFIERFRPIQAAHRLIVAPEALNRYYLESGFHGASSRVGATWMTTEDRDAEIADYIAYLNEVHAEMFLSVPRAQCTLKVLGFSQGVATAARWVAAGKAHPDQVILWAGSLPAELTSTGAAHFNDGGRPLLIVAGEQDEYITSKVIAGQVATLRALGVTVEVTPFHGGHEIDAKTLLGVANAV